MNSPLVMEGIVELLSIFLNIKLKKLLLYLYFYKVTAIPKPPICSKSSICLPRENYFGQ